MSAGREIQISGPDLSVLTPPARNSAADGLRGIDASCFPFPAAYGHGRAPFSLLALGFLVVMCGTANPGLGASAAKAGTLAATPPMGWNDWAHYQCGFTAQTIVDNARALVNTGLAARGYNTVTIDDCWMQKDRDGSGDLQPDPRRFPQGVEPVARAVHALGLKFGIYEDAGFATCDGLAGSGLPKGGGEDHFAQDARLFAAWGVDYLKLDGCNVYVPPGRSKDAAYHTAYAAEAAALKSTGHAIVFSESAPAYFQGTPQWYDVLSWVRHYGQLWREGSDMANFHANTASRPRWASVLWNYSYNLPLGRFQKPGNWNDPDFIIAGDAGLSLAESRSQMALWSMMSAPLILSSDVETLSPQAIAIVGNKAVIAIDQDPLGAMATLVRRGAATDVLFKPLANGDDAVAVLNHGDAPAEVDLHPSEFGLTGNAECRLDAEDLWRGSRESAMSTLHGDVAAHDTSLWRIHPSALCGRITRTGAIIMTAVDKQHRGIESYARCLAASGQVETCEGGAGELWTVSSDGALRSSDGRCLAVAEGKPTMQVCRPTKAQRWRYTLEGNLISTGGHHCLSAAGTDTKGPNLTLEPCGHNQPDQVWSLPN